MDALDAGPPLGYSATVRLRAEEPDGKSRSAHGFLAVARPDRLRLEILDPIGRTRLVLVLVGGQAVAVAGGRFAAAERGTEMLESLVHGGADPAELAAVLLGEGPDAGALGDGTRYVREARDESGPWPRRVRLESSSGRLTLTLGDHEIASVRDFDMPRTAGLERREAAELLAGWGDEAP